MTRRGTHYEVLGVSRTATAGQIRAAYLRLAKIHHPDKAPRDAQARSEVLALVNECYAILRHPRKRAAYDAELAGTSLALPSPVPPPASFRRRRSRGATPSWALALAIMVAIPSVWIVATASADQWYLATLAWLTPAQSTEPTISIPVVELSSEIREEAHLAMAASPDEAVSISSRCFDAAHDQPNPSAAEPCVVFDDAFLYWHSGDESSMPLYYRQDFTRSRHDDALSGLGSEAPRRQEQLRTAVFAELVRALRSQPSNEDTENPVVAPAKS